VAVNADDVQGLSSMLVNVDGPGVSSQPSEPCWSW